MTEAERLRFANLLRLAAESPFSGERRNALEAAKRLAGRHGLSLDEAARLGRDGWPHRGAEGAANGTAHGSGWQGDRHNGHRTWRWGFGGQGKAWEAPPQGPDEEKIRAEKARREAALHAARARGLDREERAFRARQEKVYRRSRRRMQPERQAQVLLQETSLPMAEIARITGLSIYQIVGLRLKLRPLAEAPAT